MKGYIILVILLMYIVERCSIGMIDENQSSSAHNIQIQLHLNNLNKQAPSYQ